MPEDLPQAAAARLSKAIDALEAQRRRAAEATVVICGQIVVLALAWGVLPLARGQWSPGGLFAAMAAGIGAHALLILSTNLWRGTANQVVVSIIAETLDGMTARIRSGGRPSTPCRGSARCSTPRCCST